MTAILTLDEMLQLLRLSRRQWKEHRATMRAAGFPARLPGMGHRWSRAAVLAWIDRPQPESEPPDAGDDVDRRLAARGAAIAAEAARRVH